MAATVIDLAEVDAVAAPPPTALLVVPEIEDDRYVRLAKPVIDRVLAGLLLLVLVPVLCAVALAVRLTLGPGVLYRQERVGFRGRRFQVLKFRTMRPDRRRHGGAWDGVDRRRTHKTEDDPRHTPLGRFLRRWSLDELPQLVNVLRGEMSLVGPRPELPHVVSRYEPWEHARFAVRPGLTGFWQTRARAQGPMHLFTNLDIDYIRQVSLRTDLRTLLQTIPAALGAQKGC